MSPPRESGDEQKFFEYQTPVDTKKVSQSWEEIKSFLEGGQSRYAKGSFIRMGFIWTILAVLSGLAFVFYIYPRMSTKFYPLKRFAGIEHEPVPVPPQSMRPFDGFVLYRIPPGVIDSYLGWVLVGIVAFVVALLVGRAVDIARHDPGKGDPLEVSTYSDDTTTTAVLRSPDEVGPVADSIARTYQERAVFTDPDNSAEGRLESLRRYDALHCVEFYAAEKTNLGAIEPGSSVADHLAGQSNTGVPINEAIGKILESDAEAHYLSVMVQPRVGTAPYAGRYAKAPSRIGNLRPIWFINRWPGLYFDYGYLKRSLKGMLEEDDRELARRSWFDLNIRLVVAGLDRAAAKTLFKSINSTLDSVTPREYSLKRRTAYSYEQSRNPITEVLRVKHGRRINRVIDDIESMTVRFRDTRGMRRTRPNIPVSAERIGNFTLLIPDGHRALERELFQKPRSEAPTDSLNADQKDRLTTEDPYASLGDGQTEQSTLPGDPGGAEWVEEPTDTDWPGEDDRGQ